MKKRNKRNNPVSDERAVSTATTGSTPTEPSSVTTREASGTSTNSTPVLMRHVTLCRSRRTYLETDENGYTREIFAPALMLAGKYLDAWGFPIGMKLDVEISEGRILITPAAEQPYLDARASAQK